MALLYSLRACNCCSLTYHLWLYNKAFSVKLFKTDNLAIIHAANKLYAMIFSADCGPTII